MKIDIEVVTGFLGYGKTSFINSLLKESQVEGEKVLIIQMEEGNKKIYEINDKNYPVDIQKLKNVDDIDKCLKKYIETFSPNRIIIEFNGTDKLENLRKKLEERELKKKLRISTIYFVADSRKLINNIDNLGYYIVPFIKDSNMIILNNTEELEKKALKQQINTLRGINTRAFILQVDNKFNLTSRLREAKVIDNGFIKKIKVKLMNL
ncbi:MAG: GTP-binding protein [Clostridium sp.]